MADEWLVRTEMLIGDDRLGRLASSHVVVFGVGGVGGHVCEALARSGVGHITIVDRDVVSESNINRQMVALHSTIGRNKVDVMKERILDINPKCVVDARCCFYLPETAGEFDFTQYDYVVDAVDTVTAKIELVMQADRAGVPIISSMGAGNKLHPEQFEITDIYKTSVCPLARVMRKELKERGIKHLKVVYSKEAPITPSNGDGRTPASIAFVPSVAGLIIAGEVIRDLYGYSK